MWWEYAIVAAAVAASLFFVARTAFRSGGGCGGGCSADGCSGERPTVLQQDVPVLDSDLSGRTRPGAR